METRKIKINNSRLEIITWKDDYYPEEFKFKRVLLSGQEDDDVSVCFYCIARDYDRDFISKFNNKSILVEGSRINKVSEEPYSREDLGIIMSFAYYMALEGNIRKVEQLITSTMDSNIIDGYRSLFNIANIKDYVHDIMINLLSEDKPYELHSLLSPAPLETGTRFSLYTLLEELERTGSSILMDPELIGKYNNVSVKAIDTRENITYDSSRWSKVRGIKRNSRKANISLSIDSSVMVNIPENEYEVEPGPKEYKTVRTYCIIKDGRANISTMGVKVPSQLQRRLKSVPGLVSSSGIYSDEFILDLTVLPVVNRKDTVPCSSITLCKLEVQKMMSKYAMDYIKAKGYKEEPIIHTGKSKFLFDLGIRGDSYYSVKEYKYSGKIIESEGIECCTDFPKTVSIPYGMTAKEALDKKKYSGSHKKVILEYLSGIDVSDKSKLPELYKFYKEQNRSISDKLNRFKFRILMGRTGNLTEGENINGLNKIVTIGSEKFNFVFKYKKTKSYV